MHLLGEFLLENACQFLGPFTPIQYPLALLESSLYHSIASLLRLEMVPLIINNFMKLYLGMPIEVWD